MKTVISTVLCNMPYRYTPSTDMDNVFLFTGENTYTLQRELSRWVREFRDRHGEENLVRLTAAGLHPSAFLNAITTAPFIAERRLIVIEGVPSFSGEEAQGTKKSAKTMQGIEEMLAQKHPQVIILFVAPKPDRRLTSTKELLSLATVETFAPLKGEVLLQWVSGAFRAEGAQIDPAVPALLLSCVGTDQQMLAQEVQKLALAATGRPVVPHDVDVLVLPSAEQAVWRLLDLLGEGRAEEAVLYCRQLLKSGESAQGIWGIVLWIVTSFASVAAAVQDGATGVQGVMEATGVKFNAARALLPLVRSCRREQLQELVERTVDADIGLKTGTWKAGADSDEELCALLDRCLLGFPSLQRG